MGVWKQVGQNLAGLAKHVAKSVVDAPIEVVKDAVGIQMEQGQPPSAQGATVGAQQSDNQMSDFAKAGFKTQDDYAKYQQMSGNKDLMELAILRKRLHQQQGLDVSLEGGMEMARREYEQKEEQRKKVEEHQEEQKKEFEFQKKKQEDAQVTAAKGQSSAEQKAWGAG